MFARNTSAVVVNLCLLDLNPVCGTISALLNDVKANLMELLLCQVCGHSMRSFLKAWVNWSIYR